MFVFVDVYYDGTSLTNTSEIIMLIVVKIQTFHCSYPHLTIRVEVDIIGIGVVKAFWITGLHILFQGAAFYIQYHHTVSIGS